MRTHVVYGLHLYYVVSGFFLCAAAVVFVAMVSALGVTGVCFVKCANAVLFQSIRLVLSFQSKIHL